MHAQKNGRMRGVRCVWEAGTAEGTGAERGGCLGLQWVPAVPRCSLTWGAISAKMRMAVTLMRRAASGLSSRSMKSGSAVLQAALTTTSAHCSHSKRNKP